ncbi:MAG TPA: methyltransferase domain-containing protein, partial [Sphingobium sp.]|nr:methyltransferase domain-containing protein [Sphingobium sp.]
SSYARHENFLFWPSDEGVKFFSRYLRRRVGIDEIVDVLPGAKGSRMVDVGCGIGHYLTFGTEMGMEMDRNDISTKAIETARHYLAQKVGPVANERALQGDIQKLPWAEGFFAHAMSDSVLDSMPFEVAQVGTTEIARITRPGGYFYCTLISGDETGRDPDFCGELVVEGKHEHGTIQSYFNYVKIKRLLEPFFEIQNCSLIQVRNQASKTHHGRWHVVARRR